MIRLISILVSVLTGAAGCASQGAVTASKDMRAIQMVDYGGPEVLKLNRVPIPEPAEGQVRIRVRAASVNPIDWKLRLDRAQRFGVLEFPRIPGNDIAGTIDKPGPGVNDWKVGDAVIAALQRAPQGGYAEYAIAPVRDIAPKPGNLTFEQASGIPTAGVAVWRFLIDSAELKAGQRVLIHGGAGGVGSLAVQVAKARGAFVIATGSARNRDYLRSIGADEVIDYQAERFEDRVHDADIVFDTVGGETLERSLAVVRPGGTLVTLVGAPPAAKCEAARVRCPRPVRDEAIGFGVALREVGALAAAGKLKINVDRVFPLAQAASAQELNREGHTRGKVVLRVTD